MSQGKKPVLAAILLIALFFLGASLFINLPAVYNNFLFADQAVYFAMTQSIAYDGDLAYTKKDLARYYQSFSSGPQGIFLKKAKDGRVFYAKNFAYSLFAAPFCRVFGYNGFLIFHSLLLGLFLIMGFSYLSLANPPPLSLLSTATYLFASVSCVYFLWISPDFFVMAMAFFVLFLWLYKIRRKETEPAEREGAPAPGRLARFLISDATDYVAAVLAGVATYAKPPCIVLAGPIVLYSLTRKKILKSVLLVLIFALSVGIFFGANALFTSDWNYMGGERKTFYFNFPFEREELTFENTGSPMTSENYFEKFLLPPKFIFYNLYYYFFGRFTGIAWYFFPALLALLLFIFGRKRPYQWMLLAAILGEILIYIILMPDNYNGGGGGLANRYFLGIFPLFFFLPGLVRTGKEVIASWAMAALFLSQILFNPFQSSSSPALHVKRFPFKALPVEMTLVNNLSTNTNPYAFRVPFGKPPNDGMMHFLDDNFLPRLEPEGTWTRGDHRAEMVLKTYFPAKEIAVILLNNPRPNNEIAVTVEGRTKKVILGPRQRGTLSFPVGDGFTVKLIHLYKISIRASKGSIPYYEDRNSDERRQLGVFFELAIVPKS